METPSYYVLGADGRPYGPASGETVREWLAAGRVHAQTAVNRVGTLDWLPLGQFAEFAGAPAAPPLPVPPRPAPAWVPRRTHPLAVAGFICGLLSVTCCACCGGELLAITALVLSIIGLVEINRQPERYEGHGLAVAGLVLGGLGVVLGLVGLGANIAASFMNGSNPRSFHWP